MEADPEKGSEEARAQLEVWLGRGPLLASIGIDCGCAWPSVHQHVRVATDGRGEVHIPALSLRVSPGLGSGLPMLRP